MKSSIDIQSWIPMDISRDNVAENPESDEIGELERILSIFGKSGYLETTRGNAGTNNTFNYARTSYFHKSIGGYHGAKLRRYQELIDHQISKSNMEVLNMLNTKYIISFSDQTRQPVVQVNMQAMGNAWFPKEIRPVANADEEMDSLTNFSDRKSVV